MTCTRLTRWLSITGTAILLSTAILALPSTRLYAANPAATVIAPVQARPVSAGTAIGSIVGHPASPTSSHSPASGVASAIMDLPVAALSRPASTGGGRSGSPSPSTSPDRSMLVVRLAEQDLASRIGVPPGRISLVSATQTSWADGSLGAPRPGLTYSQVVTPGYRITLAANGRTYVYHSDTGRLVVYCGAR